LLGCSISGSAQDSLVERSNPFLPKSIENNVGDLGWPTVRGPHLTGHSDETRLADAWPSEGPPVLWSRNLGKGYSSVVAVDDRVFTQYQTLAGQFVLCLNADTGATVWQHRYDWAYETTGLYPGPRSTPTVYNQRIYFTSPDAVVGCLNWNGKLLWSKDLKKEFGTRGTDFGYACSPIVIDEKVLLPLGGENATMVALDAETGNLKWRTGDESASYTPAMPIRFGDRQLVVGYLEHTLAAFDLESGEQVWEVELSRGYDEHSCWPIYDEPYLWVSAPFQAGWQLFELTSETASESTSEEDSETISIQQVALGRTMSNDVSSSVLVDGYIYGFDLAEAQSKAHRPSRGAFRCIDFKSGEIQWSNGIAKQRRSTDYEENRESQTVGHASMIVADGKLILLTDLGELILAKASPDKYTELARANVLGGEIGWATPALHKGRLFVRNHSRLICLHIGREDLIPSEVAKNAKSLSDISQQRFWDLTVVLGVEPEYAMDPPTRTWLVYWFVAISALFGASFAVACLMTAAIYVAARRRLTLSRCRFLFSSLAFFACLLAGTFISRSVNDFVFTWPGCLFVVLVATVYHSKTSRRETQKNSDALERVNTPVRKSHADVYGLLLFLLITGLYFFACRRLSLLTEWAFLCGYFFAAPPLMMARRFAQQPDGKHRAGEIACWLFSWLAFYLGAVAVLSLRYEIS